MYNMYRIDEQQTRHSFAMRMILGIFEEPFIMRCKTRETCLRTFRIWNHLLYQGCQENSAGTSGSGTSESEVNFGIPNHKATKAICRYLLCLFYQLPQDEFWICKPGDEQVVSEMFIFQTAVICTMFPHQYNNIFLDTMHS